MEETESADLAEYVRLAFIFALLVVDGWIMWEAVKDRPDMLVLRQRVHDAVARPWNRYRETRRGERHVIWEAIQVVEGESEERKP